MSERPNHKSSRRAGTLMRASVAIAVGGICALTSRPAHAIGNGQFDRNDQYPWVVQINGGLGSGTLITPILVLTANHLITGKQQGAAACAPLVHVEEANAILQPPFSATVYKYNGMNTPQVTRILTSSQSAYVRTAQAIDMCGDGPLVDMAVVLLDNITPPASAGYADPNHLPLVSGAPQCGSAFDDGLAIGFGCSGELDSDSCFAGPFRNYNTPKTWFQDPIENGVTWGCKWSVVEALASYDGNLPGDSGGPIINADTGALCGVASRYGYPASSGFPLFTPEVMSNYSSVMDIDNETFLLSQVHVLDTGGRWLGECLPSEVAKLADPRLAYNDADGDRIPDGCDPCPLVADSAYVVNGTFSNQFVGPDSDGDGVIDACDNCPRKANPVQISPSCTVIGPGSPCAIAQGDLDKDGVGDACDQCNNVSVARSDFVCCTYDSDCLPHGAGENVCVPFLTSAFPSAPSCASGKRCAKSLDPDGDGIGYLCDNCPTVSNVIQVDDDCDGVGNACDNCPGRYDSTIGSFENCAAFSPFDTNPFCDFNSLGRVAANVYCDAHYGGGICVPLKGKTWPAGQSGRCSQFPDNEHDMGDGVGDVCDNCPRDINRNQSDSDGDGVGDVCDNCAGPLNPMGLGTTPIPPQDLNEICLYGAPADGGPPPPSCEGDGVCVNVWAQGLPLDAGRCSKNKDTDNDGVGDQCDSCKNTWNPPIGMQLNCNQTIEAIGPNAIAFPLIGDSCDANPCAYADSFHYAGAWIGGNDVFVRTAVDPVFLPQNNVTSVPPSESVPVDNFKNQAFPYASLPAGTTMKADVSGRHCACPLDDIAMCASTCPPNPTLIANGGFPWVPSALHRTNADFSVPGNCGGAKGGICGDSIGPVPVEDPRTAYPEKWPSPDPGFATLFSDPVDMDWDVTLAGAVFDPVSGTTLFHGVFATHINHMPTLDSPTSAALAFRAWSDHLVSGPFGAPANPFTNGNQPGGGNGQGGSGPGCQPPFCTIGPHVADCLPWCPSVCITCGIEEDIPNIFSDPDPGELIAVGEGGGAVIPIDYFTWQSITNPFTPGPLSTTEKMEG